MAAIYALGSFVLSSLFFASGMALFLGPIGLFMDLIDPAESWKGLRMMLGLAGMAGIAFGLGMAWYLRHLDRKLVMPDLLPEETVRFRQYGYVITDKKYDPARIVVTSQRLFILPTHFNAGPRIADFIVELSGLRVMKDKSFGNWLADKEVQVLKDRSFGQDIAGRFLLLKLRKKLVFYHGGRGIGYMPNLGYPLPPLRLLKPVRGATADQA
ncbi:MAG: hypothetical protein ACREP8_06510 [Candidatus Binatia bacterium]